MAMHQRCFKQLQLLVPYVYAQWLVEDEINHDYRVVASVNPPDSLGYDTAHRTGIIGQVFRLQKSIFVPDVRAHVLYDPFDPSIGWELCFPLFHEGQMSAVVNLEGNGSLNFNAELWVDVCRIVENTTGLKPPTVLPDAYSSCLIETRPILIRTPNNSSESLDIVEMAKAVARSGQTVLLVGHYPDLLSGRSPTIAQANTRGLSASYCFFGVEQRLDLLATGPMIQEILLESGLDWWSSCRGRYAFVLLQIPRRDTLAWSRIAQQLTEERQTEKELNAESITNTVSLVSGSPSENIRQHILKALVVMFKRAIARDVSNPEIKDNNPEWSNSGTLQDCEFGMLLLTVREWFRAQSLEEEFFSAIDRADSERLVVALVKRVVAQVLLRKQNQAGGEGHQLSFFTGEPYTRYTSYRRPRVFKYSANLDAAMITLAFLAPAVTEFNESLALVDHQLDVDGLPDWVGNLRDAALLVILDGLNYAEECRVMAGKKFKGFTSDPESKLHDPETGCLDSFDRLFFSWTASETINDMVAWQQRYLNVPTSVPPPAKAVTQIALQITELSETLEKTAVWCYERFSSKFDAFIVEDPRDLVREVASLNFTKLSESLEKRIDQMAHSVQHVYHFSQYAAIQSLTPFRLSFNEVRIIVDKLDHLVASILNSGLDASEQPDLFRTLTRQYSLGTSNPNSYSDDAWYPLVVKSLSGLLSRTLTDLRRRYTHVELQTLVLVFQRSLEIHVNNLINRRPLIVEAGDEELWSYAQGQPYVLYATQRTIFALMFYERFRHDIEAFSVSLTRYEDEVSAEQLPKSVVVEPVQRAVKVFISYKWEDVKHNAWVERLASDLRQRGVDALLDKWEVRLGDSFIDYMKKISEVDVFLFVMTTRSVAAIEATKADGGAIKFEVELALARKQAGEEMRLIPIYREGSKTASYLQNHRYADFRDDSKYDENLEQLIGDLSGRARRPPLILGPSSDKVQPSPRATEISQRVDERLVFLRDQLRGQFRQCNEFCLAFASFRLFEPSPERRDELFEDEIIVPVASPGDFRKFILVLHMVFDEGVPDVIRRWKVGQVLPDPLTHIAAVLHGEKFGQLTVLRNKLGAHDAFHGDGAHAARELSHVFETLVGVRTLARSDSSAWLNLQKAVLQTLSEVLEEVLETFEEYRSHK